MSNYTREQMQNYQSERRAVLSGFNITLAKKLHAKMIARGIDADDARWATMDAVRRGCFGYLR